MTEIKKVEREEETKSLTLRKNNAELHIQLRDKDDKLVLILYQLPENLIILLAKC